MSLPERLPDGRIRIPARALAEDGTIGDGSTVIDREHPDYQTWATYLDSKRESSPDR